MSFAIRTEGSCSGGKGTWSYTVEHANRGTDFEEVHSDSGEEVGTTDIQMKLMAILKALTHVQSMDVVEPVIIKSDCSLCIKCIIKEFDCTSDDAHKRNRVTRGFVQYLQEIWWKMTGLDVTYEPFESVDS